MSTNFPSTPKGSPSLPASFDGQIYQEIGKYARGAIMFAFEQIGGPQGLAQWAYSNPDDFYTKLFPKIVTREAEVVHRRSVDDLMDAIDGDYEVQSSPAEAAHAVREADGEGAVGHQADALPFVLDGMDIDDLVEFEE